MLRGTGLFEYFPGNYSWSFSVNLGLMAGGSIGDMHRFLRGLHESGETSTGQWADAWAAMGHQQEALDVDDLKAGHLVTAGSRYLRASVYHAAGQRQLPPGPAKSEHYAAALQAFNNAREHMPLPLQRIHVDSPDGILPGYLIAPDADEPRPVVIFYGGLDLSKEMMYAIIGHTLARRGITCLVIDTPGVGEPLRLRGVASRPDYEVPTAAIIDHIETRSDLDASRVAVMGISLGGYYAARAAAFEPRVRACVAWSGIWDWGATLQKRWDSPGRAAVRWFQLPWVLGTPTTEAALERARQWSLADVWPEVHQPLLIVHGENDQQLPAEDAATAYAAAGSAEKYLRVFTVAQGGAEHIQVDEPEPARQLIADWLARQLGAVPAGPASLLASL
jgi:dipeptidyl aminopeptidase/acylaminoacyl peptidase